MIRVLHSVSNMDRAGIETIIMNYYRHMDRTKVQFDFLCNKAQAGAYEEEIASLGGRVYRSPGLNPLKYPAYRRYVAQLFRDDPSLRLVHVHNGALGLYALLSAKSAGVGERIYHAHNTRIPPPNKKKPLKLLCKPWIKYVATVRLACGREAAKFYYGQRMLHNGQCQIVHNAISVERFRYDPDVRARIRATFGLGGAPIVGHIGRLNRQKNHARILSIFAKVVTMMPDAVLVLVGDGELTAQTKARAQALGLGGQVFFIGNVPNANEWYQAMDVFLMPSLFEGLPVVGVEAQASGLPCVFSSSVTNEIALTDKAKFLPLTDSDDAWAAEVVRGLMARSQRQDESEAVAQAGYDIALEAQKLQALYERLADKGE